ncbi:class I SAM-dependent methyltransferase [Galbibacter sp.]|uniref:class I SAM-dependent methyltransferase n=1 Tax=Galbibacter sp. TaxID=2918471 RepID=UPI003A8E7A4C
MKSTIDEIEKRFDKDVERFSNLDTGQATTLDAAHNLELITAAIARHYPSGISVLDVGCGAGNYSVKLAQKVSDINYTLSDLSKAMLDRATQRLSGLTKGKVSAVKGDFRNQSLGECQYDVIIATAVLHHLRDDEDWETSFKKLHSLLKPGGSIWIFDLVEQNTKSMQQYIYSDLYGAYLTGLKDENYRDDVFAYILKEDTPRSLIYQLDLMQRVGFSSIDVLHKNLCFASFVGFK